MNTEQKTAWFMLILIPVVCVGFFILSSLGGWRVGCAAFGLLGLIGLIPVIRRRRLILSQIPADERDRQISRKSSLVGGIASYLAFVIGLMSIWGISMNAGSTTVTIHLLPLMVFCGCMVFYAARSIALLTLYNRGSGYAE